MNFKPCVFSYNGNIYSYEEMFALIASGGIDIQQELMANNDVLPSISAPVFKALLDRLSKAFPDARIFTDKQEFDNLIGSVNTQTFRYPDMTVYGAAFPDGSIYLNPSFINAQAPIHEFAHLWAAQNPQQWKSGISAFRHTEGFKKAVSEVEGNPIYANKSKDEIESESLALIVGRYGEGYYTGSNLSRFKQWLKIFFNRIFNKLAIRVSPDTQFDVFVYDVVKDILGGKKAKSETLSERQTGVEFIAFPKSGAVDYINNVKHFISEGINEGKSLDEITKDAISNGLRSDEVGKNFIKMLYNKLNVPLINQKPVEDSEKLTQDEVKGAIRRYYSNTVNKMVDQSISQPILENIQNLNRIYSPVTFNELKEKAIAFIKGADISELMDYIRDSSPDGGLKTMVRGISKGVFLNMAKNADNNQIQDKMWSYFFETVRVTGEMGTEYGQEIAAYAALQDLMSDEESAIKFIDSLIRNNNERIKKKGSTKAKVKEITQEVQSTVNKVIEDALNELDKKIESDIAKPKTRKKYSLSESEIQEKDRLRKKLFGQLNSSIFALPLSPDMIKYFYLVAKETSFDFANFISRLREDIPDLTDENARTAYNSAVANRNLSQELKDAKINIRKIAEQNWKGIIISRSELVDKLVSDAGLTDEAATEYASFIAKAYNEKIKETLSKKISKIIAPKKVQQKIENNLKKAGVIESLIAYNNMGALTVDNIAPLFGEMFGIREDLSDKEKQAVIDGISSMNSAKTPLAKQQILSNIIQSTAGKNKLSLRVMLDDLWYAGVLSGPPTHLMNAYFGSKIALMSYIEYSALKLWDALSGGKGSVKRSISEFIKSISTSFFGIGGDVYSSENSIGGNLKNIINQVGKEQRVDVKFTILFGSDIFDEELLGMDKKKYGEQDYGSGFFGRLLSFYSKGIKRLLKAADLLFGSTIKNLYTPEVIKDHFLNQGFSENEAWEKTKQLLYRDDASINVATRNAINDRKLADLSIVNMDGVWQVLDMGKKVAEFSTKAEAEKSLDYYAVKSVRFHKYFIQSMSEVFPSYQYADNELVSKYRNRIGSKATLNSQVDGILGRMYEGPIRKIRDMVNSIRKRSDESENKIKSASLWYAASTLDKLIAFTRVAFNGINLAIDYSPSGFFSISDKNKEDETRTEKRIRKVRASIGTITAAAILYELASRADWDDDDDDGKKRREILCSEWNELHPNSKISPTNPIFKLPKKGDIVGSLAFLDQQTKKFLTSNGLAKEFCYYDGKNWVSYRQDPTRFLTYSLLGTLSAINVYAHDNPLMSKSKKMDAIKIAGYTTIGLVDAILKASNMKGYGDLSGILSITENPTKAVEGFLERVTAPVSGVYNPAIFRYVNQLVNPEMAAKPSLKDDPTTYFISKLPIIGAFTKGKILYNMFGTPIPSIPGDTQDPVSMGIRELLTSQAWEERLNEDREIIDWLYSNGYRELTVLNTKSPALSWYNKSGELIMFSDRPISEQVELQRSAAIKFRESLRSILADNDMINMLNAMSGDIDYTSSSKITGSEYLSETPKSEFVKTIRTLWKQAQIDAWNEYKQSNNINNVIEKDGSFFLMSN